MADADSSAIYGVIYLITNKINGKMYVGQTKQTLENRLKCHKNSNGTSRITYAIKKYGVDNFSIVQIDSAKSLAELNAKEIAHIARLNSIDRNVGYNVSIGGGVQVRTKEAIEKSADKLRGKTLSEEHKRKIADAKRGKKQTPEHVANMISAKVGYRHTEAARAKMSAVAIGKKMPPCTAEHRAKLSLATKRSWENGRLHRLTDKQD